MSALRRSCMTYEGHHTSEGMPWQFFITADLLLGTSRKTRVHNYTRWGINKE